MSLAREVLWWRRQKRESEGLRAVAEPRRILVHVLEQRREEVDATVDQLFGTLHSAAMPIPTDHHEGWSAGVAAADRADLARGARVEAR